jgi:hypothetical protein
MFGYRNNMTTVQDPYAFFIRQSSTSASLNPGTGVIFGINLYNMWSNLCSTLGANPGQVKFIFTNSMNYVNSLSGPTPTLLTGSTTNTLVWNVASFPATAFNPPFASFSVAVSPTAVPGSTVIMGISITPSVDVNLGNNAYTLNRVIGGPFDPNGKWLESPGLLASGDVIHGTTQFNYNIGFQNVPAINVITMDTIDNNFDLNTLEVLQSSYPVSFQVDQATRLVQFHFDGINLPAAMSDEPKSHGFVRYGIRLKPGVPANTVLKNRAHNIFDFNEPVATNQTANKLVVVSAVSTFGEDGAKVVAVPNPFSSLLTITSSGELRTITVSDLSGRVVMEKHTSGTKVELDFNDYPPGLYLVQVNSAEGHVSTIKVIKE